MDTSKPRDDVMAKQMSGMGWGMKPLKQQQPVTDARDIMALFGMGRGGQPKKKRVCHDKAKKARRKAAKAARKGNRK